MPPQSSFNRQPFKPPRPVNSTASTSNAPASKPTDSHQAPVKSNNRSMPNGLPALDDSSEDETDAHSRAHDPIPIESSSAAFETLPGPHTAEAAKSDVASSLQVIPPQLLSKLLHNHFQHDDTRITKEAMSVFAKYIETFVKEAVYRANFERGKQEGVDGFLEVEDLEKLAPQLLQDF